MNILTKEDVAAKLRVSIRTMDNWMAQGIILPPIHIGRRCYWHEEQFEAWLNTRFGLLSHREQRYS